MKAAIFSAVHTYAQAAGAWSDRDTATIEQLRRDLHAARNSLTVTQGALEMIGTLLGLPADAHPLEIVERAKELVG